MNGLKFFLKEHYYFNEPAMKYEIFLNYTHINSRLYLVKKIVLQVRCIKIKRLFQKIVHPIVAGREEKLAGSYN